MAGELKPALTVEGLHTSYHGTANPFGTGSATVTYTVRNTGNVRLAARQAVRVRYLFGGGAKVAAPRDIPELLPGAAVNITTSATGVVPAMRDTTTVTVDPRPVRGDIQHRVLPRVTRVEDFWAVPWAMLVVLLVAAGALTLLLVRRRGRRGAGTSAPEPRPAAARSKQAVGLAAILLTASAVVAGTPADAEAAESGGLAVSPARGSDAQPITLSSAAPCPAKTANVIARVTGAGFPRGGQIVVGNAPLATYPKVPGGGLSIPLTYTMRDYASTAGFTTLRGTYTFTVSCLKGAFDLTSLRDFTGSLRFTAKDAYQDGTRVAVKAPDAKAPGQSEQPVPPTVSGAVRAPKQGARRAPGRGRHLPRPRTGPLHPRVRPPRRGPPPRTPTPRSSPGRWPVSPPPCWHSSWVRPTGCGDAERVPPSPSRATEHHRHPYLLNHQSQGENTVSITTKSRTLISR